MIYTITLENMEFRAYHGCYDLEQQVGNRFLVNMWLDTELGDAADADEVSMTVSYLTAYEVVARQMAFTSRTIENVAMRIIDAMYEAFPQLTKVTVKVSKMAPPLGGKVAGASVTLTK